MQHIKRNIHKQVIRSIPIKQNEIGSYITFYLVGHNIEIILKNFTNGIMSKRTVATLRKHNVAVFSKVGTVGYRNTGYDPYLVRAKELRNNFLHAMRDEVVRANLTTRAVYNYMKGDDTFECYILVCAIQKYHVDDFDPCYGNVNSFIIESELANLSRKEYNVDPDNDPQKILKTRLAGKPNDMWGRKTLDVQIDI